MLGENDSSKKVQISIIQVRFPYNDRLQNCLNKSEEREYIVSVNLPKIEQNLLIGTSNSSLSNFQDECGLKRFKKCLLNLHNQFENWSLLSFLNLPPPFLCTMLTAVHPITESSVVNNNFFLFF